MPDRVGELVFGSQVNYCLERIRAAAIYCSDGRFGSHCDDFIVNHLNLPRYDRLVIPGGPANLAGHFETYREGEALVQQLEFLVVAHDLERVVIIGHTGCAFYSHRLHIAEDAILAKQVDDMAAATARIRGISAKLAVEAYFAERTDDLHIQFRKVELAKANDASGTDIQVLKNKAMGRGLSKL